MASEYHAGLEFVPQPGHADTEKYPYYSTEPPVDPHAATDAQQQTYQQATVHGKAHAPAICGLKRRTFWVILGVAIVVVVSAVGGGVGGALASHSSNKSSNVPSINPEQTLVPHSPSVDAVASSSATPSPTSSAASVTTTTLVGPKSTILRDCPSSNNTIYSVTTGDTIMQFRKACEVSYLNANGMANSVGGVTKTMDDCINLCAAYNISNRTQIAQGKNRVCNSICWRNTFDSRNDWAGGQCFGFTTQNTTSNGESVWRYNMPAETRCDSAALMNQEF
ncbi:hypothetical protein NX059_005985 [Plenodomus lindquistii]|nr:hypothetical protein NX059_005985 [Plenodomus lindquistii]